MHFSSALNPRRVARSLSTILVITLLQIAIGVDAPLANAASGSVGSTTASGTCASTVGETSYVTATFVNDAFCLLKFSTSTSWTVPTGVNAFDILVVGGGGGGGGDGGGGGGGGEVRTTTGVTATAGVAATITVGTGGTGSSHTPGIAGSYGGTSSLVISGTTYSAGGGANGVGWQGTESYALAGSGGSGGSAVTGTTNYSRGGRNSYQTNGGAGTVGYNGVSTSFTGSSVTFSGGGGGGICSENLTQASFGGLAGGSGGGGRGALYTQNYGSDAGQPGTNGLGGGGGGGSACGSMATNGSTTRTPGGRGGDGVVYIKFVPVVQLSANPQATSGAVGATATFSATPYSTIAGATRTKKWQVLTPGGSWTDIASTNSDSYVTPTLTRSMHGNQYRYVVTDTVGTASSSTYSTAATLSVTAPAQGDTDTAITKFPTSYGYAYTTVAGAESLKPLSGDVYTFEAWVRPTNVCTGAYCTIAGREGDWLLSYNNDQLIFITYNVNTWGSWQESKVNLPLNQWSHLALTKNSTTWSLYVNGAKTFAATLNYSPLAGSNYYFYIGERWGGGYSFNGSIDEVRLWRSDRGASIASDMNSTATSGTNLLAYWNFNEGNGATAYNQVAAAVVGSDLTLDDSTSWDADVISTQVQSGPYTVRTFKRSYLTLNGGWKVPTGVSRASTLLVAGGGGGGGGLNGGGGGAGGFIETTTLLSPLTYYPIYVGAGGVGTQTQTFQTSAPSNGGNSSAFSLTAIGGGFGGSEYLSPNTHKPPASGGSGGGASWGSTSSYYIGGSGTSGQGNKGGDNLSNCCFGAGGGGAGAVGGNTSSTTAGLGGAGRVSVITGTTLAGGGGGSLRGSSGNTVGSGGAGGAGGGGAGARSGAAKPNTTDGPQSGAANTGGGGGAGVIQGGTTDGPGAQGGTGIVVVRWITASAPTYTKPSNAYLNAGMTETFTTNVLQDSATAVLTRTFKWESSTTGASGTFSLLKQGTGSSNASFSWVPTDTSTSGSNFIYRLTVTDSDTMGLSITDSSTAFAVINRPLNVFGVSTIPKSINLSKSETFTITLGTPTYRATLSPVISGITLDTSTAGYAVIKISDTASVGTWLETLTVTDSVSASVVHPLAITIAAPPTLVNTGEVVSTGEVFAIDVASSASFNRSTGAWSDISGSKRAITVNSSSGAPFFSDDYSGVIKFDKSKYQALYTSGIGRLTNWTIDTWIRIDEEPGSQRCAVTSEYVSGIGINYFMCIDTSRTVFTGFYIPNAWTYMRTTQVVPLNTWVHLVGTWNGSKVRLYINGLLAPGTEVYENAGLVAPGTSTQMTYISKWWDSGIQSDPAYYSPISTGSVRIYNLALSDTQTAQNYSATKERFAQGNLTQFKPAKKYGTVVLESFTATSGYDTKTVSLSVGDRAGIDWDTSTVQNRLNLTVQESLTVGTYYDTITVTDSLGQSTYLPITFTVTRADTLTVTVGASHTAVYSGISPPGAPKAAISGLVGVDSATVGTNYSIPCALGGTCKIGDLGPGGGYVFYISNTPINAASGVSEGGIYLESAPRNWNGSYTNEAPTQFASTLQSVAGTSSAIGTGAENSRLFRSALGDSAVAVTLALNKTLNGVSDWFVPSYNELTTMITTLAPLGLGSFTSYANIWSSTQTSSDSTKADNAWSSNPPVLNTLTKTLSSYYLRPIRAFSPIYSDTTTPVDVETYTAMGSNLTFLTGASSNYQAVVYETSTLTITQANQAKLTLNLYGAVAGTPFTLQVAGGSGTGAVTETVTAGSTALNCRISNKVVSNDTPATEQKTCNISITKASSRNYKAETLTATIYFMTFVNSQPTGLVGSGSTIALNGQTSLSIADTATVRAPLVSSVTSTISRSGGGSITIGGEGFGAAGTSVTLKFWRNKLYITTTSSDSSIVVSALAIPSDATSGPILVITAHGEASTPSVTITP